MILPDVNVLVQAFRKDGTGHAICRPWLNRVVMGSERFGISRLALTAVIRITTDRRIFPQHSALEDALGFCEDILSQPHCEIVEPGEQHWDIFKRLSVASNIRGADVTDAWYAALAIEWGCEWITMDRGFSRFPGLKWRVPEPE